MYTFISRALFGALVLSLAACGGGSTTSANNPPVITEGASTTVSMSVNSKPTAFSLTLHATDADNDTLIWSISAAAQHGTASVSTPATGTSMVVGYTPNADYVGADSFDVQVSDGKGGTATITVNVSVANASPVITQGASTNVVMSENSSPTAFKLTLDASDINGDTLTWSISSSATHGTASVAGTGTSKAVNYTPNSGYVGSDSFDVQVSDGHGGSATITVNVSVTNVAPVITQGASTSVNISVNSTPTAFSLTLDATDANGDALTWSISSPATHGTASVPTTVSNTISVSYSPNTNYVGTDSFVVQVSDGHAGGTATFTVTVTVNDYPVITQGTSTSVSMSENGTPTAFKLTLDATDPDGDILTWSISSSATHGMASVPVAPNNIGTTMPLSYTPDTDYIGTDSFDVQVSDGNGGTATITVYVMVATTNEVAITVDAGPSSLSTPAYNRPYVSVTICDQASPTPNCQTINHIVVDTGAVGLHILSSALTLTTLTAIKDTTSSNPIGECYPLVSGYLWGTLRTATVQMSGETTTSAIPIQVINDTAASTVPSGCSGVGADLGSVSAIQANGILGLGYFKADCGAACTTSSNNVYYTCTDTTNSATCSTVGVKTTNQVSNPVPLFGSNGIGGNDNNGVIISLPAVSLTGATNVTGTLSFGVNTQPDNQLNTNATILTVDNPTGFLSTQFNGVNLCNSAIDSGSNNLNFPHDPNNVNTPPLCSDNTFYCPATGTYPQFSATIVGLNGTSTSVNFNVTDPYPLVGTAFNDTAAKLDTIASSYPSGCPSSSPTAGSFIWGLPFFFGRNVAMVIEGNTVNSTVGPFIAF